MDTPGIEPGTFRLQSGRATTALRAHYIAASGFDPPTFGLWAQHASSAPSCYQLIQSHNSI